MSIKSTSQKILTSMIFFIGTNFFVLYANSRPGLEEIVNRIEAISTIVYQQGDNAKKQEYLAEAANAEWNRMAYSKLSTYWNDYFAGEWSKEEIINGHKANSYDPKHSIDYHSLGMSLLTAIHKSRPKDFAKLFGDNLPYQNRRARIDLLSSLNSGWAIKPLEDAVKAYNSRTRNPNHKIEEFFVVQDSSRSKALGMMEKILKEEFGPKPALRFKLAFVNAFLNNSTGGPDLSFIQSWPAALALAILNEDIASFDSQTNFKRFGFEDSVNINDRLERVKFRAIHFAELLLSRETTPQCHTL